MSVSSNAIFTVNSKERIALAAALRSENMRLYAIELAASYALIRAFDYKDIFLTCSFRGVSDPLEEVRKQPDSFYESQHQGVDWNRIADQVRALHLCDSLSNSIYNNYHGHFR